MKTLELVFFDAGGGHRSAANALAEVIGNQARGWDLRLMNLQERLDEIDLFRKLTGVRMEDIYNLILRRGWTLGSTQAVPLMHGIIRLYHSSQVNLLTRYWKDRQLSLIVSVIPNFNRAIFEAMKRALPGTPMVTILTDIADYPPHFWIERQPQYLICGSPRAYHQAIGMGHSPERVFLTSGMILNPRFYEAPDVDLERDRAALGLDPSLPTALLMFGGAGSARMLSIAQRLNESGLNLQIIAICGRNPKLAGALRGMTSRIPIRVEEFTRDVPRFMRLSDFFIGKPGPGSISEAVAMGLPVIVECNAWTLPQERYNARWVEETGVGIAVRSFRRQIVAAVSRMVDPCRRAPFHSRVRSIVNRAVFEIPDILEEIMARHQ